MISKGKRRHLVSTYACLDFIRKMGLPNKGIDVFALCARGSRLLHVRKPVKPEPFDYEKFLKTAVGSSESWEAASKISTAICEETLRRQEQQVVRKPRVAVVKCVDWSNVDLALESVPSSFVEKGPL